MKKSLAAIVVLASVAGWAQSGPSPLGLVPTPVPGLSASIWTEKPQYAVGETARIHFSISQAAYVYIFDIEPTGRVRLIFPNPYSPNAYRPAGTHALPDQPTYQFRVAPPMGTETLQLVACTRPLSMPLGSYSDPYPLLGPDPESGRAAVLGLVPEPGCGCCVTAWTTFQIVSASSGSGFWPCPPCWGLGPCPPCSGFGFVGSGAGWFLDATGTWRFFVGDCPSGPGWCWYLGPDGRWNFKIQLCFGNCP
ncbi:MAG: hypothetical protein BIP78_1020 [Candidatus Bipolaricaulis sibiricus]|uniref:DUF4384 domain-containing protein n=1 Tax=Bipolaricaulis sibiricus TaxID=2501609 RepID=A0A410FUP1_BIPS1|nr:MAG: hypothetical protein BIP78_1020 [Candidatus Bipolaricaulis sibiricus]